jgi:hypothetical protein
VKGKKLSINGYGENKSAIFKRKKSCHGIPRLPTSNIFSGEN